MPRRPAVMLESLGVRAIWLALALLFLGIGLQKFTAYEAEAIVPFAARSPFLSWCYALLGVRGASALFAVIEVAAGAGLAVGVVRPQSRLALLGAAGAVATSFITASFLVTTPGAVIVRHGLPLLSLQVGQFFAKDLVLLAASVAALGESLRRG